MERKLITKTDIFIISFAVLLTVGFFVFRSLSEGSLVAEIYYDGEMVETVELSRGEEKKILTGKDSSVVIAVSGGKIYFEESPCPDKVCVKSGELSENGDFASCLPEKVVIKVSGKKGNEPDAIVY